MLKNPRLTALTGAALSAGISLSIINFDIPSAQAGIEFDGYEYPLDPTPNDRIEELTEEQRAHFSFCIPDEYIVKCYDEKSLRYCREDFVSNIVRQNKTTHASTICALAEELRVEYELNLNDSLTDEDFDDSLERNTDVLILKIMIDTHCITVSLIEQPDLKKDLEECRAPLNQCYNSAISSDPVVRDCYWKAKTDASF